MDDPVFGRSELRLPKNCDVRSLKEKKKWTRDTVIGWALNFPSFGVLNLPKVLMIFAMEILCSFFLVPKVSDPTKGRDLVYGTGGSDGKFVKPWGWFFSSMKELTSNGRCFFWNMFFCRFGHTYAWARLGGFFFGLQVDHYLTATFFRVFLSVCCAKEVQKLKSKEIWVTNLKTTSFNSSWICQRHDSRTYATRLVLVVLCLEAWQWTKWSLKPKWKAKKCRQICGAYFCEQLLLGLCFQHSVMIK